MEGHCSTGQSPQWAVVPMEEEECGTLTMFPFTGSYLHFLPQCPLFFPYHERF